MRPLHSNPRIPDFTIIGRHSCIFLLPCKHSVVGEASGPVCQWRVAHAVCQLPALLGFWIAFLWVPHTQSGSRKTSWIVEWFVAKNWLNWVLLVRCFLTSFPYASSRAQHRFQWRACDWESTWVFISFLLFFLLLFYCENPALLFIRILPYLCSSGSQSAWRSQIFMI